MKITAFDVSILRVPYRVPIQRGRRYADDDEYLLLRVKTDEGIDGWAEAQELPAQTGNSSRGLAQALHEIYEPVLVGQDPLRPEQTKAALARIQNSGSANALIEVALCEIQAKCAGLPCWKLIGGWDPHVPLTWVVFRAPPDEMLLDAQEAVKRHGFRALKVKMHTNPRGDVEVIRQLRATFGSDMLIWVDANGLYSQEEAVWAADRLAELNVCLFEDPCPLYPGERTRSLFARSPVPVMVDRPVNTMESADQYIRLGAGAIQLKVPGMGYKESQGIVDMAEANGVPCVVGISSGTGLRDLVGLHFRASLRHLDRFPSESIFSLRLAEDILEEPLRVSDGAIVLSESPGFGVQVSEEAIRKYRIE